MSGFIRLLGSLFLMLFIAALFFGADIHRFFPDEYKSFSDDLINNKWLLLVLSIFLSVVGSITKVKKVLKERKDKTSVDDVNDIYESYGLKRYGENRQSKNQDASFSSNHLKTDFVNQQYQNKGQTFADKQTGHLKKVAMKVDWTPLASGGANFKTSLLKQINSSRLEVHKSVGGFLFSGLFAVVGLGIMAFGTYSIINEDGLSFTVLAPLLFGGLFAASRNWNVFLSSP